MDWFLAFFQSPSRRLLAAQIAGDALEAFGRGAEEHLKALSRERPTFLWYRALIWRAIRELRMLRAKPGALTIILPAPPSLYSRSLLPSWRVRRHW
jgi:hypothetical protein